MNTRTQMRFAALFAITASVGVLGARMAVITSASQATRTVPDVFKPFYEGVILHDREAAVRAALPFDRVSLEQRGGFPRSEFRLTLARSGEATLWSDETKTFGGSGDFVGTVYLVDFGKLSHLISEVGFERLQRRYTLNMTDLRTLTVSVTSDRGTTTIDDYGGAGPVQLWSIEQAMMAIGHDIVWKRK